MRFHLRPGSLRHSFTDQFESLFVPAFVSSNAPVQMCLCLLTGGVSRLYRKLPASALESSQVHFLTSRQYRDHLYQHMPVWNPSHRPMATLYDGGALLGVGGRGRLCQRWRVLDSVVYPYFSYTYNDPSLGVSWIPAPDHGAIRWQPHQRSRQGRAHGPDSWLAHRHGRGGSTGHGLQSVVHGAGSLRV